MSADANVETVKAIYQAFGSGDVAAILDSCTDDVDWASDAASDDAPWWGQRKGLLMWIVQPASTAGLVRSVRAVRAVRAVRVEDDEAIVACAVASWVRRSSTMDARAPARRVRGHAPSRRCAGAV